MQSKITDIETTSQIQETTVLLNHLITPVAGNISLKTKVRTSDGQIWELLSIWKGKIYPIFPLPEKSIQINLRICQSSSFFQEVVANTALTLATRAKNLSLSVQETAEFSNSLYFLTLSTSYQLHMKYPQIPLLLQAMF